MTDLADGAAALVLNGPMLAALGVAMLAGLVSFASPCVLPLLPGYVGYLSGMMGLPGAGRQRARSGRVLAGMLLFVAGFTAVFMLLGVLFAAAGARLLPWMDVIMRVAGVGVIVLGLAFLGYLPFLQREFKVHATPRFGLWGAPVLGATFGLGWTPCIGPTLAAVLTLSFGGADPVRGAVLALAYCVGLGVPFVVIAMLLTRSPRAWRAITRHKRAISVFGGVLLIALGLALVTGLWTHFTSWLQAWIGSTTTVL